MTEEAEDQPLSQTIDPENHENSLISPKDHNSIEEVINLGVYGLTGVNDAVSKPNDDNSPNGDTQSIDPQTINALNEDTLQNPSNNNDDSQITNNETDSNSDGIAANADEDEVDSVGGQNQTQGELESLPNQLENLLPNTAQQDNLDGEYEEEEEEEEARDPEESNTSQIEAENKNGNNNKEVEEDSQSSLKDNNNEKEDDHKISEDKTNEDNKEKEDNQIVLENNTNKEEELTKEPVTENSIQGILTAATDVLLQQSEEEIKDQNKSENDNVDEINKENSDSNDKNADENTVNNDSNADNENNNENNDNNENEDNDNSTDGMSVHDEFKDPYADWGSPLSTKGQATRSVSHLPPLETTPELDSQSKRFLEKYEKHGKLPDPEYYSQILQYIQRQKVNSVISNDFISAGHYQSLTQRFINSINSSHQNESHKVKIDRLEEKLEETNNRVRNFQHETDELIKQERYRLTDKRAQIVNIHEEDLNKFEERWNDEIFLVKYAKPSSDLLQAKKIERSFILNKDFEGAESCRKKVAELEKLESQAAQKRARSEMEKQYKKLTSKQDAEIESFDENAKEQLQLVSKDRSNQLEILVARQNKLQSQLHDLKNPGRQSWASASGPVQLHGGSKAASMGTSLPALDKKSSSQLENLMTPRTVQRYALFKTTMKQPKLTVKPLGSINQKRKQVQAPKF